MNLSMSHRNTVYNLPYLLICEKHLLLSLSSFSFFSLQLFNEFFYIVIFINLSLFKSTKYHFKSIRFYFFMLSLPVTLFSVMLGLFFFYSLSEHLKSEVPFTTAFEE